MDTRNLSTGISRAFVAAAVALTGLATAGCQIEARREFSLTPQWADYDLLVVRSRNGYVELSAVWGPAFKIRGQVRVHGETQEEANTNLDQLTVVAEPDASHPGTYLVELRVPEALNQKSPGADFVIQIPKACAADVSTSNGSINILGLKGRLNLNSSNGSITATNIDGQIQAETSNAKIKLDGVNGAVTAQTSNGDVIAMSIAEGVSAATSNGSIQVEGASGDINAHTSNGGIRVDAGPGIGGAVVLETSNGSIDATLPAQMTAAVDLSTSNGRVDADFMKIPVQFHEQSRTRVKAGMNGGAGGRIKAETSNGSITLRFR